MRATAEIAKAIFDEYNVKVFGGKLPAIRITTTRERHSVGYFQHCGKTPIKIAINSEFEMQYETIVNTMVHEMIHYYICINEIKDDDAHGRQFCRLAEEISQKHGLRIEKTCNEDITWVQRMNIFIYTKRTGERGICVVSGSNVKAINLLYDSFSLKSVEFYKSEDNYFSRWYNKQFHPYKLRDEEFERICCMDSAVHVNTIIR